MRERERERERETEREAVLARVDDAVLVRVEVLEEPPHRAVVVVTARPAAAAAGGLVQRASGEGRGAGARSIPGLALRGLALQYLRGAAPCAPRAAVRKTHTPSLALSLYVWG